MATFAIRFCWPLGVPDGDDANCDLNAHSLEVARMQAAMLYATLEFPSGRPCGYQILQDAGTEVYRYPEPTIH